MDPDGSIRQPLWSRMKLTLSIVTDVRSLCRLLSVGSWFSTLFRRAVRRGGIGRDHLLTELEHGVISGQTPSVALSGSMDMHPAWSYPWHRLLCQRGSLRGKERPGIFEGPPWHLIFLLSPICNPCFPFVYKREGRALKSTIIPRAIPCTPVEKYHQDMIGRAL